MGIESARSARWKFLLGGVVIAIVARTNSFIKFNDPLTTEVLASFVGAAAGGVLMGWATWWIWAKLKGKGGG